MSYLQKPLKFDKAIERLKARKEIASHLNTKQWADVPAALRDRAFFSSRVASARFLHSAKRMLQAFLDGEREEVITPSGEKIMALKSASRAQFVKQMHEFAISEGMGDPLPEGTGFQDQSVIQQNTNIRSPRRLGLIFETNLRSSYGYGNFEASVDPDVTDAYPAWRFIRTGVVKEPRPLHKQNEGAVRRKDDVKFWLKMNDPAIGGLGVPHGPWGFNSQMDVQEVSRREAMKLGLIKSDERIKSPKAEFNKQLSLDASRIEPGVFGKLKKALGKNVKMEGWKLKWAK